jgi:hypothetical protein
MTGTPFFTVIALGVKSNFLAVIFTTFGALLPIALDHTEKLKQAVKINQVATFLLILSPPH